MTCRGNTSQLRRRLPAGSSVFVLGIGLSPIYLFPSGYPQIGDFFTLMWIGALGAAALSGRVELRVAKGARAAIIAASAFAVWTVLVSLAHTAWLADPLVARSAAFYTFNVLIFCAFHVCHSHAPDEWGRVVATALKLCAAVLLAFLLKDLASPGLRNTGGYNNPNQLGYNSILLFCVAALAFPRFMSRRDAILIGVVSICGVLLAASWSALFASVMVAGGFAIRAFSARKVVAYVVMLVLVVGAILALFFLTPAGEVIAGIWEYRSAGFEKKTGNVFTSRGYDRILDYPHHLFFGAGEGALWRFNALSELHSTFGTVIFSYGFVGLALFLRLLWLAFKRASLNELFIISSPFVYSLTHQGLRTTGFWIFLAVAMCYSGSGRRSKEVRVRTKD